MNSKKDIPILLLHGWGKNLSGERYKDLASHLEKKGYRVYTPDLPGFGKNPLSKEALEFDDYVIFVHKYITETIKVKKVILAGHSFGGRIAIRFAATYPSFVEKLILIDASGIPRPLPSFKKRFVYTCTKIIRPFFSVPPFSLFYTLFRKAVYYSIGEMDYYKAGNLTQTFKNVYQVSIVPDLGHITAKTLILWGEKDTFTPLADGALMHEKILGSKFVIIPDASHKMPYENSHMCGEEIISFL